MLALLRTIVSVICLYFVVAQANVIVISENISAFELKMYAISYFTSVFFVSIVMANFVWSTILILVVSVAASVLAIVTGSSGTTVIAMQTSSFLGITLALSTILVFVYFDIWRRVVNIFKR